MRFNGILVVFIIASVSRATVLSTAISQDSLFVGDRVHLCVSMLVPKAAMIIPPSTDTGFGRFAVKEWNSDKVEKSNVDSLSFKYVITLYTTEQCTIPALPFVQVQGDKKDTLYSQKVPLRLVLVNNTDSTNPSIKGLKPQQAVGSPSLAWLCLLLGIGIVAAGIYALKRYVKNKGKGKKEALPKPPYEEAMAALALLDEKQYLSKGMVREYVFELSDIFKRYIERRFEINAAEFTTEEMLDWTKRSTLEPPDRKIAEWFFSTADPVKFAKWLPDTDTLYRFGKDVRQFIEQTRPRLEEAPKPVDGTDAI
jgi:hypothetical protein